MTLVNDRDDALSHKFPERLAEEGNVRKDLMRFGEREGRDLVIQGLHDYPMRAAARLSGSPELRGVEGWRHC